MFTARDKADCAEREVRQRRRVYARLVFNGRMSQAVADRETALMQAIAADYAAQAEKEEAEGRLL
jgi:hypothetical protein